MNLRFTPRAVRDITEIADYIRVENPRAAEFVRAAILESLRTLTVFPLLGRAQTISGVRKLVTRKYRYLVYYTADDLLDEVVVLSVQHPARMREYEDG